MANVMGICGGLVEPKSVQVGPWAIIVHKSPARVQILKSPCKSKTRTCCICIDMKIENVLPARVGSMILKMPFLNQGPWGTVILHLARRGPSEMKIMKISPPVILGRPGGMRGGAGGRFEGGQRSADLNLMMWTSAVGLTRQLLAIRQGRRIQSLRAFRRAYLGD